MSRILLGVICGAVFGTLSVLIMIPLRMKDKTSAMTASFLNRFSIGFVIGAASLPVPGWVSGLIFGCMLSLPEAVITKAWIPIMSFGLVGGLIIGLIVGTPVL